MREVKAGEYYRHFKDKLYQVIAVGVHTETGEKMVVYEAQYEDGGIFIRPYEMFVSEVDREKYPDVKQKYRFERVEAPTEVNPMLVRFLEAETYRDKLELFQCWEAYVDDQLLESIAASLDVTLSGGDEREKYRQIVSCLRTLGHFEVDRKR